MADENGHDVNLKEFSAAIRNLGPVPDRDVTATAIKELKNRPAQHVEGRRPTTAADIAAAKAMLAARIKAKPPETGK